VGDLLDDDVGFDVFANVVVGCTNAVTGKSLAKTSRYSQDYMLSLVIWVSPRVRQPAGLRLASRFDGSTRQSGHTAQSS